jgi:hypothetical protein
VAKPAYSNETFLRLLPIYENQQLLLLPGISNYIPIIAFECHVQKST